MVAVEAVGLEKEYRGWFGRGARPALGGVDLLVPTGSLFGLIGLNGAGKTTFIKSMLAVVRPTRGLVRVLGGDPEEVAVRARIGYLPERLYFPRAWTALAFMESVAHFKGLSGARARADIRRQLERVGLAADAERKVGAYSKGMRQRLGLATALLGAPELLVLDEPTDGVDPLGRTEIRRILSEERDRGATIFLNSHLLAETERLCDRIGILHRGRMVLEGSIDALGRSGTRWLVRFAPEPAIDPAALAALGFTPEAGDRLGLEAADPRTLNAALDRARALGALIISVQPVVKDLEQLLAGVVGADP